MTTLTCTRRLEFDAAHRVPGHEHKCRYLHGHRYAVEATFVADDGTLDGVGRVIDFGVIRERLGTWIDTHWDHTTILADEDKALGHAVAALTGQEIYYLPTPPTAEYLAAYLLERICPELFAGSGVRCISIRIQETPNCRAEASF